MKPSSIHLIHGFKTALATVACYGVTQVFNLEFGYWAVISTVIVMQVYVADSIDMCLYRLSGTLIGAALGAGVMLLVPHTPVWMGVALFVTTGSCAFLTLYKTRYRMAAITAVIIILTGVANEHIIGFTLFRVLEIGIGIICAFLVSVMVFPRRRIDALTSRLLSQAEKCSQLGQDLVQAFVEKQQHIDESLVKALVAESRENQAFLVNIHRHEVRLYHLDGGFQTGVFLMTRTVENLRNMARILNSLEPEGHHIIMAQEMAQIAKRAGQVLVALNVEPGAADTQKLADAIDQMDHRLFDIRKEGLTARFDLKRLLQVMSFYNSLKYYAQDILEAARKMGEKKTT